MINVLDSSVCHGKEADVVCDRDVLIKGAWLYKCRVCHCGFYAPKREVELDGEM